MGSLDGAEVCDLLGRYLLNILKSEFGGKNIRLYRDGGLSCFKNKFGLELKKKRKMYIILKNNDLSTIIETNLHITD